MMHTINLSNIIAKGYLCEFIPDGEEFSEDKIRKGILHSIYCVRNGEYEYDVRVNFSKRYTKVSYLHILRVATRKELLIDFEKK